MYRIANRNELSKIFLNQFTKTIEEKLPLAKLGMMIDPAKTIKKM